MVVFESGGAQGEMMPQPKCTSPLAREIEYGLQGPITEYELLGDDKVISPEYRVGWQIHLREFDMDLTSHHAADAKGRTFGFAMDYPVTDLARNLPKLRRSTYRVDRAATLAQKAAVEEVIGDLMPVVLTNWSICWIGRPLVQGPPPDGHGSDAHGDDRPAEQFVGQPYDFVTDDIDHFLLWQEREGILTLDNGNHYAGAGSYGFSNELRPPPTAACTSERPVDEHELAGDGRRLAGDVCPDRRPSYHALAEIAGLVYYGCCEPVHSIWSSLRHSCRTCGKSRSRPGATRCS